jgi:histidinol-phosphatase (PHP family)
MTHSSSLNGHIPHDYHMHSDISCDCKATMSEMAQAALNLGISEIAFTEHFDRKPEDLCAGFYRPDAYFQRLEAARSKFGPQGLTIRAGVEVGEMHIYRDEVQPVLERWPYDFVLGSLHWVGDNSVFDNAYFTATPAEEAIPAYFSELVTLVRGGGFDVLAHPDVFKRTTTTVYGGFDIAEWEGLVRDVWRACIETGIGIEINTAGLRTSAGQPHPPLTALHWYREMGGELLTVGSDSHYPRDVGYRLDTALDMARAAGFTRLACYEQRHVVSWTAI